MSECHDMDMTPIILHMLCRADPTWAKNRIKRLSGEGELLREELERVRAESQAIDLRKAIEMFAAVSDSLTLRKIVESSDFPAAIKCIERLSGEGELLREALEKIEKIAAPLRHSMWHQVHAICKSVLVSEEREQPLGKCLECGDQSLVPDGWCVSEHCNGAEARATNYRRFSMKLWIVRKLIRTRKIWAIRLAHRIDKVFFYRVMYGG